MLVLLGVCLRFVVFMYLLCDVVWTLLLFAANRVLLWFVVRCLFWVTIVVRCCLLSGGVWCSSLRVVSCVFLWVKAVRWSLLVVGNYLLFVCSCLLVPVAGWFCSLRVACCSWAVASCWGSFSADACCLSLLFAC